MCLNLSMCVIFVNHKPKMYHLCVIHIVYPHFVQKFPFVSTKSNSQCQIFTFEIVHLLFKNIIFEFLKILIFSIRKSQKVQKLVKKKYSDMKFKFYLRDKHPKNKRLSTNFCTTTEEITLFE